MNLVEKTVQMISTCGDINWKRLYVNICFALPSRGSAGVVAVDKVAVERQSFEGNHLED